MIDLSVSTLSIRVAMPSPNRARSKALQSLIKIVILATVGLSLVSCRREGETGLNPGDRPPPVELNALDGSLVKLSDYTGKVVLLNFWASWCGPCIEELPALQSLYERLKERGFIVLGIGIDDTPSALLEFKTRFGVTFPVLVDVAGKVKSSYRVSGVPETFIIGADGRLVMLSDPEGNIPVLRFIGPREWSAPNSVSRFEGLLSIAKQGEVAN